MRNHRLRRSPESAESVRSRRLSFSNCDLNNPTQLNHMYNECADQVHKGLHPVSRQTAIRLAAVECFVLFGPYKDGIESSIRFHFEFLLILNLIEDRTNYCQKSMREHESTKKILRR